MKNQLSLYGINSDTYVGKPTNGDFITAYHSQNAIAISSLPDEISAMKNYDIAGIEVYDAEGNLRSVFTRNGHAISVTNGKIQIKGLTPAEVERGFESDDNFIVYTNIPREASGSSSSTSTSSGVSGAGITVGVEDWGYTFDASAQTVEITGLGTIKQEQIGVIVNITDWEVIYSPTVSNKGGTLSGNVLTLDYDTTSMSDDDLIGISLSYDVVTDYDVQAERNIEINPEYAQRTDFLPLVTAQDLTTSYADFGDVIDAREKKSLLLKVGYDVNDSWPVKLKVLGLKTADDSSPADLSSYVSEVTVFDSGDDDWFKGYIVNTEWRPYLQIQAKDEATGQATFGDLTIDYSLVY